MNKILKQLYGLPTIRNEQTERRPKPAPKTFEKLQAILKAKGLELSNNYNKWYNVYDGGTNVRYEPFDSLGDVKEWIKNDMAEYIKTKERL